MNSENDIRDLSSMDRKIKSRSIKPIIIGCMLALAAGLGVIAWLSASSRSFTLNGQQIRIAEVQTGVYEDYIPLRAVIEPERTVYLDAIEGGRIEAVLVEEGTMVAADQPLIELSNTSLQLDVIAREAEVSEQINNLRNTQLAIEQNRLKLKGELIEIDYQILRLERLIDRYDALGNDQLISRSKHESSLDELNYWKNRRAITQESQAQGNLIRQTQIQQLNSSIEQLDQNLLLARANLDNLLVRAPRSGRLTSLHANIGESKGRGERLGQIDDVDRFKAVAQVNEFYLNRVRVGQQALLSVGERDYQLEVSKIYPHVRAAQFEVDLRFLDKALPDVRRGQSLQLRLVLSDSAERTLLLANGPYFNDTGGTWVFALSANTEVASRRWVQLGRRNPKVVEIEAGLELGERVIVSSYASFIDVDRLNINQ